MLASNTGRFYLLLLMRLSSAMTSLAVYTQLDGLATQISPVGWTNESRASWMGRAELPKERHRIIIKGSSWMDVQRTVHFFFFYNRSRSSRAMRLLSRAQGPREHIQQPRRILQPHTYTHEICRHAITRCPVELTIMRKDSIRTEIGRAPSELQSPC